MTSQPNTTPPSPSPEAMEAAKRLYIAVTASGLPETTIAQTLDAFAAKIREQTIEAALACVPGGDICDPQLVADKIRALKRGRN